ncbi:MAG: hypothetical protein ACPG4Z_05770 [Chitinophagales bacterium]
MKKESIHIDERALIMYIDGTDKFKQFLLANGLAIGTVFRYNYSPGYAGLVNLSVGNRILSLRENDFAAIEWVKI